MDQVICVKAVPSSEGGMIVLPTYLLSLSKRFLIATRTRLEGRAEDLKLETQHGDKRYRVWLAQPRVDHLATIEYKSEGMNSWITGHRYSVK